LSISYGASETKMCHLVSQLITCTKSTRRWYDLQGLVLCAGY